MNLDKFRDIPGFPGYKISEYGKVYSEKRNIFIAEARNWGGYMVVTISDPSGYRAPRKVHRLVYRTYIGELEDGKVIDHKDNNKDNNHYTNLQQITPSQNSTKSFITGKNSSLVIWPKDIIHKICKMIVRGYTNREIFESLGVDYNVNRIQCNTLIGNITRGSMHKDVTVHYNISDRIRCINKADVKLTIGSVRTIYAMLKYGKIPASELARYYDVSHHTICKIRDKQTWKAVTDNYDRFMESIMFNDHPLSILRRCCI
jgi:hypothetical protein